MSGQGGSPLEGAGEPRGYLRKHRGNSPWGGPEASRRKGCEGLAGAETGEGLCEACTQRTGRFEQSQAGRRTLGAGRSLSGAGVRWAGDVGVRGEGRQGGGSLNGHPCGGVRGSGRQVVLWCLLENRSRMLQSLELGRGLWRAPRAQGGV